MYAYTLSHSSWRKATFLHYSNNFYSLSAVPSPFFGGGTWVVLDFDLFVFGIFFGFVLFCFVVTDNLE